MTMTSERRWEDLTPEEKQAAWEAHDARNSARRPDPNYWAFISVGALVLSLVVGLAGVLAASLVLFSPVAIVTGGVGEWLALRKGRGARVWATIGVIGGVLSWGVFFVVAGS